MPNCFYSRINHCCLLMGFSLLAHASSKAEELVIQPRPFAIESRIEATVMPDADVSLIALNPKSWERFEFTTLAKHGATVAKGDTLAAFDSTDLQERIDDLKETIPSTQLRVDAADQEIKLLTETAPFRVEATRRAADIAKEELAYFTQTDRKAQEDAATQQLERRKQLLENEREELKQLGQMYKDHDLTDGTEEIILVRQRNAVTAAELNLRLETLNHKRELEVLLPRKAIDLAEADRIATTTLKRAEKTIAREIEIKKAELEILKTHLERDRTTLADLQHDLLLCKIVAPADGIFYHGPIESGRWTTGDLLLSLKIGGPALLHRPFATFVPKQTRSALVGFVSGTTAYGLSPELVGEANLPGRNDLGAPATVRKISTTPETNGNYRVDLDAKWPKGTEPSIGTSINVRVISYQNDKAIVVPTKALKFGAHGWTVELKLADGKTERRPVHRGRDSGEESEILKGLELGQVVITP